jgi:hypothetical protein
VLVPPSGWVRVVSGVLRASVLLITQSQPMEYVARLGEEEANDRCEDVEEEWLE